MCGLFAMAVASSALAHEHYIEVWNPPEARGATVQRQQHPAHKASKRRRVSFAAEQHRSRHRIAVSAPASPAATASSQARPTFDEIPRQITPEGNVLRVTGGHAQVRIAR